MTLTDQTVQRIKARLASGERAAAIAESEGISRTTVYRIKNGRTFASGREGEPKRTKTRMTRDQRARIKRLKREGHTNAEIAERVGVHESTVYRLVSGATFTD